MNADIFAEWLKRQGHQIFKTKNSYWFDQGPRVYQAFPYHWVIDPDEIELINFLRGRFAIGLRFSTHITSNIGKLSYHAVFDDKNYDLGNLSKWARKNVRRGLKNCSVQPIPFDWLAEEGWELQLDTLDRQGRHLGLEKAVWQNRCLSAMDLPGFEAWGALINGKLAASVITYQMDDCGYMLYQQCKREYLSEHVNNALSFVVSQELISRPDTTSILYGLHSLDAPPSVDEFKFRMGYRAKPVRQRVVFHPNFAPLFNPLSYRIVNKLLQWFPGNVNLAKAEGMARFYLQGKRPLLEQEWPPPLAHRKLEFC